MTLPTDWGTPISSQINAFLAWSAVAGPVQTIVGVSVGAILISMFLAVWLRGR
jgi:hypothetical protein